MNFVAWLGMVDCHWCLLDFAGLGSLGDLDLLGKVTTFFPYVSYLALGGS